MAIALFGVRIMSKLNEFGFAKETLAEPCWLRLPPDDT